MGSDFKVKVLATSEVRNYLLIEQYDSGIIDHVILDDGSIYFGDEVELV